jgi:peptidoglycan/xylan/chitin deacetylase (PgdA/CDA1 family)
MRKIFVPFKERYGKRPWPNQAKLAFAMYIAVEEWTVENMKKRNRIPPGTPRPVPGVGPDLSLITTIEYGYRAGVWRLLETIDECNLKVSILASSLAAETHPELFQEVVRREFEIIGHGYDQAVWMAELNDAELHETIRKSVRIFQEVTGTRPTGWGSPGTRQHENILALLLQEGFSYHMGLHDDEIPYFIEIDGKKMVEIPYRIGDAGELNDYYIWNPEDYRIPSEAFLYLKEFFDAKYEESSRTPQLVTLGCHPYVSGRPDHAKVIKEFLKYVQSFKNVWIAGRFGDVADWWSINGEKF